MNVFQAAMMSENYFEKVMEDSGYERFTTFSSDLTIAELMGGEKAIKETFNRVVKDWKDDVKYFTEFTMALNIKAWELHERGNDTLTNVYSQLYYNAREFALDTFKGDDLSYFLRTTD